MTMPANMPEWGNAQPAGGERHLPVYLLLDTSESMNGAPIESLRRGLELFKSEIESDPFTRDIVKIGIITFSSDAQLVTNGLVTFEHLSVPDLVAFGVTRLDLAFNVLFDSMNREPDVIKAKKGGQKGDWKPAVFVLTDGFPTDGNGYLSDTFWKPARDAVMNRPKGQIKPSSIVSVGCGPNVDDETLKSISTGTAFRMGTGLEAFVALFQRLSQSIGSSLGGGNPDDPFADMQDLDDPDLYRIP